MTNTSALLPAFVLLLLVFGCGKDDENPPSTPLPAHTCFITKEMENSFVTEVLYDSENRPVRINGYQPSGALGHYATYTYSALGKVIRLDEFDGNGELSQYFTYDYDSQLRLIKITNYYRPSASTPFELSGYQTFEYSSGNKLVKMNGFEGSATAPGYYELLEYTGPNVTRLQGFAAGSSSAEYTYTYTYDTQHNPYRGMLHYDLTLPHFISSNNALSETRTDAAGSIPMHESVTYSYQYNAQGYPIEAEYTDQSGYTSGMLLEYNCP